MTRMIAVASGKGGVGKTWFAVTLAHALALRGRRVLLFDGDLGLANVDVQLGLAPRHDLGAVVAGRASLAAAITAHPCGFAVLAGSSGSGALSALEPDALERLLEALRALAAGYDDVVLDLGAGLDRSVRRMAVFADVLLVLATDEPTSLTDAYAVLKLHAADHGSLGHGDGPAVRVVVNQAASPAAGQRTFATLAGACAKLLGAAPAWCGATSRCARRSAGRRRCCSARQPARPRSTCWRWRGRCEREPACRGADQGLTILCATSQRGTA